MDWMFMFIVWAIRKKNTNDYLPQTKYKSGYTYDEPITLGGKLGPRLFMSKQGAEQALRYWLRGKCYRRFYTTDSMLGSEVDEHWEVEKVEGRNKEDMEIVRFELHEALRS